MESPTSLPLSENYDPTFADRTMPAVAPTGDAESIYRFPLGRTAIEIVPDLRHSFSLRLFWIRGKATIPLFETTPLRPIGYISQGGDTFPLFLSRHARKNRQRLLLAGRRKTGRSSRSHLRFGVLVDGREDRLEWQWHIGGSSDLKSPGEISLLMPFAPGKPQTIRVTSPYSGLAVLLNEVVITIVVPPTGELSGLELTTTDAGVSLRLPNAALETGVRMHWQTWLSAARTVREAENALMRHLSQTADAAQTHIPIEPFLLETTQYATKRLAADSAVDKRGLDRLVFRDPHRAKTHSNGTGADTALVACAFLGQFYQTGDDLLRRRARLLSRGVCDFQINIDESPHWGAIWDTWREKKRYASADGSKTLGVATTARAAKALLILHNHFETEILQRTALAASHWLMLKLDRDGLLPGERFLEEGPAVPSDSHWILGETIIPLVETFRRTENEVYLKTAMRVVGAISDGLHEKGSWDWERANAEHLAVTVEGILLVSREYERQDLIELAQRIAAVLRSRRLPDGSFIEPEGVNPLSPISSTLVGARTALAIARVDGDAEWILIALRALRFAAQFAEKAPHLLTVSDFGMLMSLPTRLLLMAGTRTGGFTADVDLLTLTRGHQVFKCDPGTREYIQVLHSEHGAPLDHLCLVSPTNLQVLIIILAPKGVEEAWILKNNRRPFFKNMLTGEFDQRVHLVPLGDGSEVNIGIVTVDT